MLEISVRQRRGEFALDVTLAGPARGTLVIVGESGSGKTSLLRLLAGLAEPDEGRIALDGRVLVDTSLGVWVPARARGVGYVPQETVLFPHLTARANVAFGLRARGVPAREADERAGTALARMGVAPLAGRRPPALSGGQRQRVALARALAPEPALLLLDEPLSALDLRTRREIRGELGSLLAELACASVLVTHSPTEALALGDTIAVLEQGRVVQAGRREDLLLRPRSRYVAAFLGTNLLAARAAAPDAGGLVRLDVDGATVWAAGATAAGPALAVIAPHDITLSRSAPEGSARNVLAGVVTEILPEPPHGERVRVSVATRPPLVAELTAAAVARLGLAPGTPVHASFKATGVRIVDG